jgi:hypothetical protein
MAASIVATIGTIVIGSWGSARIEEGIVHTAATTGSSYGENHIAPHLQELASHYGARASHTGQRWPAFAPPLEL